MPAAVQQILAWVAALGISAAAIAGLALWLFKKFSEKWLQSKFDKQLESHKHAQQRELEKLKLDINTLFDRTAKLHQHEFEILPTAWALLNSAFGQAAKFTSPLQSYPDLNNMTPEHRAEYIAGSELQDWQKVEVANAADKTTAYTKAIFWHDLTRVRKTYGEFHNYFITKGIFIQPELKAKLSEISDMLFDAIQEKEFDHQYPVLGPDRFKKSERVRKEGPALLKAVEATVQERLWRAPELS